MQYQTLTLAVAVGLASSAAHAADWALDPESSTIQFEATAMGNTINGGFQEFETEISFDPEAIENASVVARIAIESIEVGIKDGAQQLQGADWFDAANHPTATFTSTGFEENGGGLYDVSGELELKGMTAPVVLPLTITVDGDRADAVGELTIDRHQFNIGEGEWSSGNTVSSEVLLRLEIEATRQ